MLRLKGNAPMAAAVAVFEVAGSRYGTRHVDDADCSGADMTEVLLWLEGIRLRVNKVDFDTKMFRHLEDLKVREQ